MLNRVLCAAICASLAAGCVSEAEERPSTPALESDDGGLHNSEDPSIAESSDGCDPGPPRESVTEGCDREEPSEGGYEGEHPEEDARDCTMTQGYWKTHFESWRLTSIPLGDPYPAEDARGLLLLESDGDASLILAHQLIAALLNVANGATSIPAIEEAQGWMRQHGNVLPFGISPSSAAGSNAVELSMTLTGYNEGRIGPGHCEHGREVSEAPQ